jgi:DNA-binding XRE family transcriptional regulator
LPFCHGCIVAPFSAQPKRWICTQTLPNELRTIGDHIKARRIHLHFFQNDVAKQIGVHFASIQNWERNLGVPMPCHIPGVMRFLGYVPFPKPETQSEILRSVRICCGWTQGDLAKATGCAESSVGRWESGEHPQPNLWSAAMLAMKKRLLQLEISDLLSSWISSLET